MRFTIRPRLTAGRCADGVGPAINVDIVLYLQEFGRSIQQALRERAVPRPDRDICDRIFRPSHVFVRSKMAIEHIKLPLRFHREPIDRIFDLGRRISVEMTEPAAEIPRAAHLPKQPVHCFGAAVGVSRQKGAEFFCKIKQDRSGFEHSARLGDAAIDQRGNLRIRVGRDKAAAELVALADLDQPRIIFASLWPSASNSSSITVTLTPLGVAKE